MLASRWTKVDYNNIVPPASRQSVKISHRSMRVLCEQTEIIPVGDDDFLSSHKVSAYNSERLLFIPTFIKEL